MEIKDEKELQNFIADNPWLINQNYESVPELDDQKLEYQVGDQKRIDLILRDKISKNPVIVEFKFTPFYRENIGQILEYRARVASSFTKENSKLFEIFKDFILCPKLVLVVKECDDFSRIACNLSGIDILEFRNFSKDFLSNPEKVKTIVDFTQSFVNDPIPLNNNRPDELEKIIYQPIKNILGKYQFLDSWKEPLKRSNSFFYYTYSLMFVNRWIFQENLVSIGIYEDIIGNGDVIISYFSEFSENEEKFKKFVEIYLSKDKSQNSQIENLGWRSSKYPEGYLNIRFNRKDFFTNVSTVFEFELNKYLDVMKQLK